MSALVRIPDSSRTSQHVRKVPCVDGSELARAFFTYAALVGAAMCSARLWSRLVSSLVCSLAGVHLSVVKLGHGTGLAPGWRCAPGSHPTRCSRTRGRPRSRPSLRSEGLLLIERRDLLRLDGPVRVEIVLRVIP